MFELLAVVFGGLIVYGMVEKISDYWRKAKESNNQAALTQKMLERGLSTDEIERLLRLTPEPNKDSGEPDWAEVLAAKMVRRRVSPASMGRVLEACRSVAPSSQKRMSRIIARMVEKKADEQQILAALRALFPPAEAVSCPDARPSTPQLPPLELVRSDAVRKGPEHWSVD